MSQTIAGVRITADKFFFQIWRRLNDFQFGKHMAGQFQDAGGCSAPFSFAYQCPKQGTGGTMYVTNGSVHVCICYRALNRFICDAVQRQMTSIEMGSIIAGLRRRELSHNLYYVKYGHGWVLKSEQTSDKARMEAGKTGNVRRMNENRPTRSDV